jgi:aminoglycoside phosphotransferase (APT) family kinase protein
VGFEQVKQWSISTVLRVKTTSSDFYFKVSKDLPLFVNEAAVTARLAGRFPGYVPRPVAIEAEQAWMLFAAFELIQESAPVDVRREVFARFGQLQRSSVGMIDDLFNEGCLDRRLAVLESQIEPLMDDEAALGAMTEEERRRLRGLASRLKELTHRLADLGLPHTLVHGDMHLGNTARVDGNLAFFDWTDASVAHPFIDLQSLKWETDEDEKQSILDAYLAGWDEFAGPDELRQALAIAEALTPLHHAVSYQHILANLEPAARPELDFTADYLRRVIAGADALGAE